MYELAGRYSTPTTIKQAHDIYQQLPSMCTNDNSVPLRVYLHSIHHLLKTEKIIISISTKLVNDTVKRLEAFDTIANTCGDLTGKTVCKNFTNLI